MDQKDQARVEDLLIRSRFDEVINVCSVLMGNVKQPSKESYRICVVLLQAFYEAGRFAEAKDLISNKFDGFARLDFDTVCLWSVLALSQHAQAEVAKSLQKYLQVNNAALDDSSFAAGSRLLCIETLGKELRDCQQAQTWLDKHAKKRSSKLHADLSAELKTLAQGHRAFTSLNSQASRPSGTQSSATFDPLRQQSSHSAWPSMRADPLEAFDAALGAKPANHDSADQHNGVTHRPDRTSSAAKPPKARRPELPKQPFPWVNVALVICALYIFFIDRNSLVRWLQRLGTFFKDSLLGLGRLAFGSKSTQAS